MGHEKGKPMMCIYEPSLKRGQECDRKYQCKGCPVKTEVFNPRVWDNSPVYDEVYFKGVEWLNKL